MMQTEFAIDDDSQDVQIQDDNSPSNSSTSTPSRRPRRAAAEAAAKTIHVSFLFKMKSMKLKM